MLGLFFLEGSRNDDKGEGRMRKEFMCIFWIFVWGLRLREGKNGYFERGFRECLKKENCFLFYWSDRLVVCKFFGDVLILELYFIL